MRRTVIGTRQRLAALEARAERVDVADLGAMLEPSEAIAICCAARASARGDAPDVDDWRAFTATIERLGLRMVGGRVIATRTT